MFRRITLVCTIGALGLALAAPAGAAPGARINAPLRATGADADITGNVDVRTKADGSHSVQIKAQHVDAGQYLATISAFGDPDGDGIPNFGSTTVVCRKDHSGVRRITCSAGDIRFHESLTLWQVTLTKLENSTGNMVAKADLR